MTNNSGRQEKFSIVKPYQGVLLGVVLDLSGSMTESIRNDKGYQYSKIEGLTDTFQHVLEDSRLLLENTSTQDGILLRLFIIGFGFQTMNSSTVSYQIGDVFSILSNIDEQIERYKLLRPKVEDLWLKEIEQILEDQKITGDAEEELCSFVEQELREQATQAEMQRGTAKFQRWCDSVCQRMSAYDRRVRKTINAYGRSMRIALPFLLTFLWLLRGPAHFLTWINHMFENIVQGKLTELRENADKYASKQSQKVASVTNKALNECLPQIHAIIEQSITAFIDEEAFSFIQSYDTGLKATGRKVPFDRVGLKKTYESVTEQISRVMSPHANFAWRTSIFLLKQGAKALKIQPDWDLLREKTTRCAQHIIWERMSPEVRKLAERIIKRRFLRAILITIVQKTKNNETTLSLAEVSELMKHQERLSLPMSDLPIFNGSPLGTALNQTFLRLWREKQLAENKRLRPAILIISDGEPTDGNLISSLEVAEKIKRTGIPIICCFVTNRDIGHPWKLRQMPRWRWPQAARLMFSMASSIEEWPEFTQSLIKSRFIAKPQSKLFMQINHTKHLRDFVEAILLPIDREQKSLLAPQIQS
jgi:hypothetical protein